MSEATRISAPPSPERLGPPPADSGRPAYRVLADRIRAAVLDGRLAVATGLPSERDLATGLSLSRTTVGAAYALLRDQGWLDSRRGSGSPLRLPIGATVGHRRRRSPAPSRRAPRSEPGGIFGWQEGVGWQDDVPTPGTRPAMSVDLTTACLPAPAEPLLAAVAAAVAELPRYLRGDGYLPVRPTGIARRDRVAVHRGRRADHRGTDAGHLGCPACLHADRRGTVGGRRPGADRMPDLPGGAGRAARAPTGTGPGRDGRTDRPG